MGRARAFTNGPQHSRKAVHELAAIGDFECGYCDFRDTCYPQLTLTEIVEAGGMTEDQALERLYDAGLMRRPAENQEELDEFFAMPDY